MTTKTSKPADRTTTRPVRPRGIDEVVRPADSAGPNVPARPPSAAVTPLRITVLMGGPSAERAVSLESGKAVADALASLGHTVLRSDISPDDLSALDPEVDVVFIALHGTFGEDGQLQAILEERGLRFCGSGAAGSALAMDKVASKRRFIEAGIPTPRFDIIQPQRLRQALGCWSLPVVLKPVAQGSSVGCHLVADADGLRQQAEALVAKYGSCMIEQFIGGRELTVGILGDQVLPPIEIRTGRAFYDYTAKYEDDDTEYIFDTGLPAPLLERVERLSLEAHRVLGCRDFSRVDWMVDETRGEAAAALALEVNTIPGFTSHSLLPKAAARAGLGFAALCQRIVELAMQRDR